MIGQGIGLIIVAGILGGSVLAPIKVMLRWRFEKSWAVYSIWAYLIMPWAIALFTVPHLVRIYPQISAHTMIICALCGIGWGTAVVLYGAAVHAIGLSLTTAILYGLSIAVGSIAPLLISDRARLVSTQGMSVVLADAGVIAGVLLCTWAGRIRDIAEHKNTSDTSHSQRNGVFVRGMIAAILGAFLSSLFNIALAYGGEFNRLAMANGASSLNAANAQWAFTVTFGYLPNLLSTIVTFSRRRYWNELQEGPPSYWLWPPLMGLMFIGGTVLYGSGAGLLGNMGPVLGWPMYMSMSIIGGVFWGYITKEWENAPRRSLQALTMGVLLQLVFICVLGTLSR